VTTEHHIQLIDHYLKQHWSSKQIEADLITDEVIKERKQKKKKKAAAAAASQPDGEEEVQQEKAQEAEENDAGEEGGEDKKSGGRKGECVSLTQTTLNGMQFYEKVDKSRERLRTKEQQQRGPTTLHPVNTDRKRALVLHRQLAPRRRTVQRVPWPRASC
jgi:hypothetical protein